MSSNKRFLYVSQVFTAVLVLCCVQDMSNEIHSVSVNINR